MVSRVSAVSEKPLHVPPALSPSRARFANLRGGPLAEGEGTQWVFTDLTDYPDRWRVGCRLLATPTRESGRLADPAGPTH